MVNFTVPTTSTMIIRSQQNTQLQARRNHPDTAASPSQLLSSCASLEWNDVHFHRSSIYCSIVKLLMLLRQNVLYLLLFVCLIAVFFVAHSKNNALHSPLLVCCINIVMRFNHVCIYLPLLMFATFLYQCRSFFFLCIVSIIQFAV